MKPKDEDGAVSSRGGAFGSGISGAGVSRKVKPLDASSGLGAGTGAGADPLMKEKLEDCTCVLGGSGAAGALVMKENAEDDASAAGAGAGAGVEPLMNEKPDGLSSLTCLRIFSRSSL